MKFGQVIEYNKKKAGGLVPDLVLFVKKGLYEVKAIGLQLSFNIF